MAYGGQGYGYAKPAGSSDWAIRSQQMAFGLQEQANQYDVAQGQALGRGIAAAPEAFVQSYSVMQEASIRAQTARANLLQEELRRRRLQQDIDMTDRLQQSDSMGLQMEMQREQLRALRLQNDTAEKQYEEETSFKKGQQQLDLFKIAGNVPAAARTEAGEIVLPSGLAFNPSSMQSRVLTEQEFKQYEQQFREGIGAQQPDQQYLESVRMSLPNDESPSAQKIRAAYSKLRLQGASRQQFVDELTPLLDAYEPAPVKDKEQSTKFATTASEAIDDIISDYSAKDPVYGTTVVVGDPSRLEFLKRIKSDIVRAKIQAESNMDNKQLVDQAKEVISASYEIAQSPERIDGYLFYEMAKDSAPIQSKMGLDSLKMEGDERDAVMADIASGFAQSLTPQIERKKQELLSSGKLPANVDELSQHSWAYTEARRRVYDGALNDMSIRPFNKAVEWRKALGMQGYSNESIRKIITENLDLDETEVRAVFGETR